MKKLFRKFGFFILLGAACLLPAQKARACCCVDCDISLIEPIITGFHVASRPIIKTLIGLQFQLHREWMADGSANVPESLFGGSGNFFRDTWLPAFMQMINQMSAMGLYQAMVIGSLIDAKHQLETERLFQQLMAEAHRDYHPSEDYCWIGTAARTLTGGDARADLTSIAMTQRSLGRQLGNANMAGGRNRDQDRLARWREFAENYCDPHDNGWGATGGTGSGLMPACGPTAIAAGSRGVPQRRNKDVDYTGLIESQRSLNVDFSDTALPQTNSGPNDGITADGRGAGDEMDVLAMANNLYAHNTLTRSGAAAPEALKFKENQHKYLALRAVAAKRSVAEHSFNSIVGLKAASPVPAPNTREFMAALMVELGVPPDEAYEIIGERPSYFAALEIIAKKIYTSPDFFANLYDKPANVKRKGVAIKAIDLLLDRLIHESQIRQEMALSVLLSIGNNKELRELNKEFATLSPARR